MTRKCNKTMAVTVSMVFVLGSIAQGLCQPRTVGHSHAMARQASASPQPPRVKSASPVVAANAARTHRPSFRPVSSARQTATDAPAASGSAAAQIDDVQSMMRNPVVVAPVGRFDLNLFRTQFTGQTTGTTGTRVTGTQTTQSSGQTGKRPDWRPSGPSGSTSSSTGSSGTERGGYVRDTAVGQTGDTGQTASTGGKSEPEGPIRIVSIFTDSQQSSPDGGSQYTEEFTVQTWEQGVENPDWSETGEYERTTATGTEYVEVFYVQGADGLWYKTIVDIQRSRSQPSSAPVAVDEDDTEDDLDDLDDAEPEDDSDPDGDPEPGDDDSRGDPDGGGDSERPPSLHGPKVWGGSHRGSPTPGTRVPGLSRWTPMGPDDYRPNPEGTGGGSPTSRIIKGSDEFRPDPENTGGGSPISRGIMAQGTLIQAVRGAVAR
jgi:hypothetical protein